MNSVIIAVAFTLAFLGSISLLGAIALTYLYEWYANRPITPTTTRTQPDPKFMVSGVWGKNASGDIVDLRIHNPRLAYKLLGGPRRYLQLVEQSTSRDGQVTYSVHRVVEVS